MSTGMTFRKWLGLFVVATMAGTSAWGQSSTQSASAADYTAHINNNSLVMTCTFSVPPTGIIVLKAKAILPAGWSIEPSTTSGRRVRNANDGDHGNSLPALDLQDPTQIGFVGDLLYELFDGSEFTPPDYFPAQPITFKYNIVIPPGEWGPKTIRMTMTYRPTGGTVNDDVTLYSTPNPVNLTGPAAPTTTTTTAAPTTTTTTTVATTTTTTTTAAPPEFIAVQWSGGNVGLTWSSTTAGTYSVQATTSLYPFAGWSNVFGLESLPGMNGTMSAVHSNAPGAQRFYRVRAGL